MPLLSQVPHGREEGVWGPVGTWEWLVCHIVGQPGPKCSYPTLPPQKGFREPQWTRNELAEEVSLPSSDFREGLRRRWLLRGHLNYVLL
jgi:hypothetical protein